MSELLLLIPSPLGGLDSWQSVSDELGRRGVPSIICPLALDEDAPEALWSQQARAVAAAIAGLATTVPLVLVGHSGAGAILPAVGAISSKRVQGYVIVDGPIPKDGLSPLDMMRGSIPRLAEAVRSALAAGRRFPDPDAQSRARKDGERPVSASPRGRRYFEEPIAVPAGWSDSSCGYIKLSAAFDQPYQEALLRGWPTRSLDGDHFLMLTDASSVADALVGVVAEMRLQVTGYSRRDQS